MVITRQLVYQLVNSFTCQLVNSFTCQLVYSSTHQLQRYSVLENRDLTIVVDFVARLFSTCHSHDLVDKLR